MAPSPLPPGAAALSIPVRGFFAGARYLVLAARLLAGQPRLARYLLPPLAVGLVAGALIYLAVFAVGSMGVGWLMGLLPLVLGPLGVVLHLVLMVAALWLAGLVVAKFGVILGSPWYGLLAEEVERMRLPADAIPEAPEGAVAFAVDVARAFGYEAKKAVLILGIGVPALLLNFLPGVGSLAATLVWGALGVTTLVLDFVDPALERRRLGFRQKLVLVLREGPTSLGFGVPALVLAGIPLVNLLTVPLGMVAGTLFYCDRLHARVAAADEPAGPAGPPLRSPAS